MEIGDVLRKSLLSAGVCGVDGINLGAFFAFIGSDGVTFTEVVSGAVVTVVFVVISVSFVMTVFGDILVDPDAVAIVAVFAILDGLNGLLSDLINFGLVWFFVFSSFLD